MPSKAAMDGLLALSDDELSGPRAAELEDAVQRALAAVHLGELWIGQLRRALAEVRDDPDGRATLERELAASRASVEDVREEAAALHRRAQQLGVGTPAAR